MREKEKVSSRMVAEISKQPEKEPNKENTVR